jgi:hypothetical protein
MALPPRSYCSYCKLYSTVFYMKLCNVYRRHTILDRYSEPYSILYIYKMGLHGLKHASSTFLALIFLTSNPFLFVYFFTNTGSNTHHLTVCTKTWTECLFVAYRWIPTCVISVCSKRFWSVCLVSPDNL